MPIEVRRLRLITHDSTVQGPPLGTIFGCIMALGAGLATLWLRLGLPLPDCRFHDWTGLPCPTCGSTRMAESLLHGSVVEALSWNPLVFLGLTGVALWACASTIQRLFGFPAFRLALDSRERIALRLAAVLTIAASWSYLIWRGV